MCIRRTLEYKRQAGLKFVDTFDFVCLLRTTCRQVCTCVYVHCTTCRGVHCTRVLYTYIHTYRQECMVYVFLLANSSMNTVCIVCILQEYQESRNKHNIIIKYVYYIYYKLVELARYVALIAFFLLRARSLCIVLLVLLIVLLLCILQRSTREYNIQAQ